MVEFHVFMSENMKFMFQCLSFFLCWVGFCKFYNFLQLYQKQNSVQHYLNWSWYCTLCASYFWIFVLSFRCCLFPGNFMTTVIFSSTGWSESAISPMNSLCVKQNSLSEITDKLHLLLRLRAIVSVVVLWSNNGVWTEIWIQPSACFNTTSKRSLELSWNQCSVWAYSMCVLSKVWPPFKGFWKHHWSVRSASSYPQNGECWYIIYIEFLLNSTFSLVVNTPRPQAQINCLILEPSHGSFINVGLSCFASIS